MLWEQPLLSWIMVAMFADGGCLLADPVVTVAELAALAAELARRGLRPRAGWSTHPRLNQRWLRAAHTAQSRRVLRLRESTPN